MNWREEIGAYAAVRTIPLIEHALGIGIEFRDGSDAFWILPGEVTSTILIKEDEAIDSAALLKQFERIDALRARAIHVIAHHLAQIKCHVSTSGNGAWGLTSQEGLLTALSVGARLTNLARDENNLQVMVDGAFQGVWIKGPSPDEILQLAAIPGSPPEVERSTKTPSLVPETVDGALVWLTLCRALDNDRNFDSPESMAAAFQPRGRIGQAIMHIGKRLPQVAANLEITTNCITMDFEDGEDAFNLDPRSREFAKSIKRLGPEVAGDQMADQYLTLNAARRRILQAIWRAAAARGWSKQQFNFPTATTWLGSRFREVSFSPGESLTEALRKGDAPDMIFRHIFPDDFAQACIRAWQNPQQEKIELPTADLLPKNIPSPPLLRELTPKTIREVDAWASQRIKQFFSERQTLWKYDDPFTYDPARDTWATQADWITLAEQHISSEWADPMAIKILLDANDPRGDLLARKYVQTAETNPDTYRTEVELVWRYRQEFPEVARQWLLPQPHDDVPYAAMRAPLGDPIALRYMKYQSQPELVPAEPVSPESARKLYDQLLTWAKSDYKWAPPDSERLKLAYKFNFPDVAAALEENPFLASVLLTIERREDQFDEPGILMAGEFFLVWSRFAPSRFIATLIATRCATDLAALAQEASRRSLQGKPDDAANHAMSVSVYREWEKQADPALAIAWTRCRSILGK